MTDEELGRAWCAKNGKRPWVSGRYYDWHPPAGVIPDRESNLPFTLHSAFHGHLSESAAYAAVGVALRALVAAADEVRSLESTA